MDYIIERLQKRGNYGNLVPTSFPFKRNLMLPLSCLERIVLCRLKAGTSGTDECGYCETRRGRGPFTSSQDWTNNHVINVTFPPAASRSVDAVGTRHFKKGFSGNSVSVYFTTRVTDEGRTLNYCSNVAFCIAESTFSLDTIVHSTEFHTLTCSICSNFSHRGREQSRKKYKKCLSRI